MGMLSELRGERNDAASSRKELFKVWNSEIRFVSFNGDIVHKLEGEDNKALTLYRESQKRETDLADSRFQENLKRAMKDTRSPTDHKQILKWISSGYNKDELKTKRVKKVARNLLLSCETILQPLTLSQMLSPHTYCFAPFRNEDSKHIEDMFRSKFFNEENWDRSEERWIKTDRAFFYIDGVSTEMKLYLNRYYPRMKLKMYVKNKLGDNSDVLDVEADFRGNRLAGISHYHVVKPCTINLLSRARADGSGGIPYFFEMSHDPNTGNVSVRYRLEMGSEQVIYTEKDSKKQQTSRVLQLIEKNPIVAGGSWFVNAIRVLERNPKYEVLQIRATI